MAGAQYFEADPAVASRRGRVELVLRDGRVELAVDTGVFSATRADAGTVALLRAIPAPPRAGDLLDLGCGYGPIALTLARRAPGATVWALDVNSRALSLVKDNAAALGLSNVRAAAPTEVPAGVTFAGIWSNPPIRIGKAALHDLLGAWLPRLAPGGSAWLVVHKHLGADSLAEWLGQQRWRVSRVGSKQGYRILSVSRLVEAAAGGDR
ncbi:MAG: class I SAM-dependent methyltransferase [Acidimicrobiales bacterium]